MRQTKAVVGLSVLLSSLLASGAFALDRDTIQNHMNQIRSLQSALRTEQGIQRDLTRTKELLLELDKTNKEETAKLEQDATEFVADVDAYEGEKRNLADELKRFHSELISHKTQVDRYNEELRQHSEAHSRHESWRPDPRDHGAVDAYNAEADQLDAWAQSLNAQQPQLSAARAQYLNWTKTLDKREDEVEQKRQALSARAKALEQREKNLKWAREKANEQTLKWAADTKRNNARLSELAAQLNASLTMVAQLSSKCSSITGVGTLDLTNLNSASEQAHRCLQQLWDGAGARSAKPVRPKPD